MKGGDSLSEMDRSARGTYMLELLARDGELSVAQLSRDLGVSEVTIRGQLRELDGQGLLSRTHGGARPTSVANVLARQHEHSDEKKRIARQAAALVRDDDRIMIEAGTTTSGLVQHLSSHRGVQIVTNSTLVFAHARHNTRLTVILTGGSFHRPSESLVGPVALRALSDFHVRLAFVGTDGFTRQHGLTTQFSEGAEIIRTMHEQADDTWLMADASKFGRAGFVRVLPLVQLAGIITDDGLTQEGRRELLEVGLALNTA